MKIKKISKVYDTPSFIKNNIFKWLNRIGVNNSDIEVDYLLTENWAKVSFVIDNKIYSFKSDKQIGYKQNLKAIEIFLHNRVISIERGIEEFAQAFKGYKQLEHKNSNNEYENLNEKELNHLLKIYHPDIPTGNREIYDKIMLARNKIKNG